MPVQKLSVSLSQDVHDQIVARAEGNVSHAVNRSLDRYFALLGRARSVLRATLSEEECALILDATNGTAFTDTVSLNMLWAEIEDAAAFEGLGEKWSVDGAALVEKIKAAGMVGQTALIDSSERWWNRVASGEQPAYKDLLA